MSIFDFFLAALSLASVGLFLLFWRMFPRDRGVHPIYRESGIEMIDNGPGGPGHDRAGAAQEVESKCKTA